MQVVHVDKGAGIVAGAVAAWVTVAYAAGGRETIRVDVADGVLSIAGNDLDTVLLAMAEEDRREEEYASLLAEQVAKRALHPAECPFDWCSPETTESDWEEVGYLENEPSPEDEEYMRAEREKEEQQFVDDIVSQGFDDAQRWGASNSAGWYYGDES